MANIFAVHSVGESVMTFLRNTYPQQQAGRAMPNCAFEVISSGELADDLGDSARLTLYLYQVTVNQHSRQSHRPGSGADSPAPLGLDLHFMLTAWAGNALEEQVPLAWAMRQLHQFPVLDASSLSPEAGWGADEVIQIIPAELSTEDLMRIWDALEPAYRLSVSYVARLVRLEAEGPEGSAKPVVARRLAFGREQP